MKNENKTKITREYKQKIIFLKKSYVNSCLQIIIKTVWKQNCSKMYLLVNLEIQVLKQLDGRVADTRSWNSLELGKRIHLRTDEMYEIGRIQVVRLFSVTQSIWMYYKLHINFFMTTFYIIIAIFYNNNNFTIITLMFTNCTNYKNFL